MAIYPICETCGTLTTSGDGRVVWDQDLETWIRDTRENVYNVWCGYCKSDDDPYTIDTDECFSARGNPGDEHIIAAVEIEVLTPPHGNDYPTRGVIYPAGDGYYYIRGKRSWGKNINVMDIMVLRKLPPEDGVKDSWTWEVVGGE